MVSQIYKVMCDVGNERICQDKKWGEQNHSLTEWVSILGEEFGELCQAVNVYQFGTYYTDQMLIDIRKEAIHTAAVAVAMIECIDRKYK